MGTNFRVGCKPIKKKLSQTHLTALNCALSRVDKLPYRLPTNDKTINVGNTIIAFVLEGRKKQHLYLLQGLFVQKGSINVCKFSESGKTSSSNAIIHLNSAQLNS